MVMPLTPLKQESTICMDSPCLVIRKNWGRYQRYQPIWKKTLFETKTSSTLKSFESLKNASTFGPILIHIQTKHFIREGNVLDLAVGSVLS